MAGALRPLAFFGFVDHRKSDRTQGRRRVHSNRRRSQRPRPCDPRSPLTRLRGYLTGQTEGSTDCATLRRRERTRALGFAPLENEMWSQRRRSCRRSGEVWSHGPAAAAADGKMWSHFVFLVYGRIPASRPLLSGGYQGSGSGVGSKTGAFLPPQGRNLMITVPCHNQTCFGRQSTHHGRIRT